MIPLWAYYVLLIVAVVMPFVAMALHESDHH